MSDIGVNRRRRASLRVYFSGLELTYDDEESVARGNLELSVFVPKSGRLDFFFQNFIFYFNVFFKMSPCI